MQKSGSTSAEETIDDQLTQNYRFKESPLVKGRIFREYAVQQNMIRTRFIAGSIFVLTIAMFYNDFLQDVEYGMFYAVNIYGILSISLLHIITSTLLQEWYLRHYRIAELVLIIFWVSTITTDIPTFIRDATTSCLPINLTTWLAGMGILLVVTRKQATFIFSFFLILNVAIAIIFKSPAYYITDVVTRTLLSFCISYFIQYPYNIIAVKNIINSSFDPLTKCFNRREGMKRISTSIKNNRKYKKATVFYMLDLDNFKIYNDTYGHQIGDKALTMIAESIRKVFSGTKDTNIRYGGEEFLVCANIKSPEEAKLLSDKLHKTIAELEPPIYNGKQCKPITVSIGYVIIYAYAYKQESLKELIYFADLALYEAKKRGKNCSVEFTPLLAGMKKL